MRHGDTVDSLVEAALGDGPGKARAVARLISLVESSADEVRDLARALVPLTGRAHLVGLTGSPGVGKSTTTSALVSALRARGRVVGVLAVDPTSPFSGGALLGDRVRMGEHTTDPGVFIRSMASRGHLGGLAAAAPQALRVFDAAGCDIVLVETVGVGQSEIEVSGIADTTLVLLAPGMGDGIQAAKAGILEIGDVFCINKADRDGATTTRRELRAMLSLGQRTDGGWQPPIVLTVATTGSGIDEVVDHIDAHRSHLATSGEGERRRLLRADREIRALAVGALMRRFGDLERGPVGGLAGEVVDRAIDPFEAADRLVEALTDPDAG